MTIYDPRFSFTQQAKDRQNELEDKEPIDITPKKILLEKPKE